MPEKQSALNGLRSAGGTSMVLLSARGVPERKERDATDWRGESLQIASPISKLDTERLL